jgi:hypothetical protein
LQDKRYGWIKMRALIAAKKTGAGAALEKFAKEKKQQIPMESFVKCLVSDGLPDDATRFVGFLTDSRGNPLGESTTHPTLLLTAPHQPASHRTSQPSAASQLRADDAFRVLLMCCGLDALR